MSNGRIDNHPFQCYSFIKKHFHEEGAMCCLTTIFLVLASRIIIVVWWLSDPQRFTLAVKALKLPGSFALPVWAWTLLGFLFLPWTTLAYLYVFPGGIVGSEWIVLAVAFLIDLFGHGGSYRHRNRFSGYRRRQT
jgi:hypothetical protein